MNIDGACHCGQIQYRAEIDPEDVLICHCTDCQTLSGSAYRTVAPAKEGHFSLLPANSKPMKKRPPMAQFGFNLSALTAAHRFTHAHLWVLPACWELGLDPLPSEIS